MAIKINRKLNFVIPVELDTGQVVYVHSTPIMAETFDMFFEVIGKAYTQVFVGGGGVYTGPRLAKKYIRKIAENMDIWEGTTGVKAGLIDEIHRLTNVVYPNKTGWGIRPFDDAVKDGIFNEEDLDEVENAICFFTLASAMLRKAELSPALELTGRLWGSQVELLNCTEFAASLTISTTEENIGEKAKPSSIPS